MVKTLQEDLKKLGYYTGRIDGSLGPMTRAAIKTFQRHNGLVADGYAGRNTQAKLLEVLYGMTSLWIDKQTLVITIPNPKLDVITNTKETVSSTWRKLTSKPILLFNGGLFSDSNNMAETVDNGVVDRGVLSRYVMTDKGVLGMYWAESTGNIPKEAIGAGPLLMLDGNIKIDSTGFDRNLINTNHPRLALGYDKDNMYVVVVHGRRSWRGHYGCSIDKLASIMKSIGCEDAIGLDGGGSIYVLNRYGKLLNQPTETRRVNHCIALRG